MKLSLKIGIIAAFCLVIWPAVAGAAPPAPKGKLVYEDDFSSKKSGLADQLTASDYSRGFHAPGVYHLKDVKDKTTNWELFPNQSYGEFSYQVDVWDNSDDVSTGDLSGGLVFRATDETHFYALLLDPRKGQYAVRKLNGKDSWSDLVAWTEASTIKRRTDVNQVRVDGSGSNFTIYVNGEELDTFSDSAFAKGGIGFIADNVDAPANHLHFDNIKVYSTEAAAAPASLPNTGQAEQTWLAMFVLALAATGLGFWLRRRAVVV